MNGTAVYGEPVVVVEVGQGNVRLRKGRIASDESSHVMADNHSKTVVWGHRVFSPPADPLQDKHEKQFSVDDIHLLKVDEAKEMRDLDAVNKRFGSIYEDWVVRKIHLAVKRLKL